EIVAESMSASGRSSEKFSLPGLQSKMKCDPEGYTSELRLIYSQFISSLELFQQQAALSFTSLSGIPADLTVAKDLGDRAMFLSHLTPFYRKELVNFPGELLRFLETAARSIPSGLRLNLVQALILLINRNIIDTPETLAVFMELQTLGDRQLKKLASSHVFHSIRRMNQKHKNDPRNKALQNTLFGMLQKEEEAIAKRALAIVCDLHRRRIWFDDRAANAICMACFHSSPRIMIAALSFLLDFEKIEDDDDDDDDDSSSEEETLQPQVVISKEAIYKASSTGTTSSKKKKKAKLQRAIRSMKKQQRVSSERNDSYYYSPLNHLKDPQGFAEKLFSRLKSSSNERFEVKMMMLKVIARVIGLHRLIFLDFYPHLQKYVQPHQRDVTNLLAAAVQACHDMVPPDAVEPLFKQIVNQFVHDRSRPEAISVGLNVVREICLRMPLLMTEDLLQDLVLYRKSQEKAVSSAARSLLTLFREVCPSLLAKKDRGRPSDPQARPKAYGEVHVASNVPGLELLEQDDASEHDEENSNGDEEDGAEECGSSDENQDLDDDGEESGSEHENCSVSSRGTEENGDVSASDEEGGNEEEEEGIGVDNTESSGKKRKLSDFDRQLDAARSSLRALKRLAKTAEDGDDVSLHANDGILSNEDFQRIKELKVR
ncbi:hypothetical protein M569_07614, partial [Genlisea aurea]